MLRVQPISFGNQYKKFQSSSNSPAFQGEIRATGDDRTLKRAMQILGALGLTAVMFSCDTEYDSIDDYHRRQDAQNQAQTIRTDSTKTSSTNAGYGLIGRTDNMLNSIGLLKNDASIRDVKTISFLDNKNTQHWLVPKDVCRDYIKGVGFTILSDWTQGYQYSFVAERSGNGLEVHKVYRNGEVEKEYIEIGNNGSIVSYEILDSGLKLEKSITRKSGEDSFIQQFSDGKKLVCSSIYNNLEAPIEVVFDAGVSDYENVTPTDSDF